ncbi:rhodanese-like domain-containing protein [Shewanella acanthi]|uniref:rhodanese-like domain-containing protein n=1 Tax=Shewanella acanthi TaxID=2864212 RepID=UPI001C65D5D2|nr:rhodanese-like domain-containing protein [Shewanella acanthi]MCH1930778.1 sulfurtransferase [Shewanella shenzhenensis]QYJ79984.1 sulfurtransferase [Shewanella acanthi]
MQQPNAFLTLVESIRPLVTEISIEAYQSDDAWVLIDVREDKEWLQDHLPQAKHLSRGIIERDIEARFPDKATPLLLYCAGGVRSVLAAHSLQQMGYTHVASMIGGYKAWVQRQLPLVQE